MTRVSRIEDAPEPVSDRKREPDAQEAILRRAKNAFFGMLEFSGGGA